MSLCYHEAMVDNFKSKTTKYLFPEEYKWFKWFIETERKLPDCSEDPCIHWPIFTVLDSSPYRPYYGKPETYKGFRSDPRPLLGVLALNDEEYESGVAANQEYLRKRLGFR